MVIGVSRYRIFLASMEAALQIFLLQSFGLASFLLLLNFLFWGLDLIIKKELRRIILKLFLVVAYLTVGTVFIYLTFDNSFWLIDNGNSGFVGKITYNFINTWAPWIDNTYSIYGLLLLTIIFFSFSADISYKKVLSVIISLFRSKPVKNIEQEFNNINIENQPQALEKPQQSFSFDTDTYPKTDQVVSKTKYKLPDINYLEKIYLNLVLMEIKIDLMLGLWKKYY